VAEELCLIIEGVYVTRQVTGRPEAIHIARRLADRVLAAHLRDGAVAPPPITGVPTEAVGVAVGHGSGK
jgi:hypothetical protein